MAIERDPMIEAFLSELLDHIKAFVLADDEESKQAAIDFFFSTMPQEPDAA